MLVDIRKVRSYVMNRILIIDDDKELCMLIKRSVCAENIEADICNTGREGIQQLKEQEYQLVILDVMMPGMDGFQTCDAIRKDSNVPVLFLTAKSAENDRVSAYSSGGDDFLSKPFSSVELLAKVSSLLRRYKEYRGKPEEALAVENLEVDFSTHKVTSSGKPVALTDTEYAILAYLLQNRGRTVTAVELYEAVWNEKYLAGSSNTVMVHVLNLRRKIEENSSSPKIVRTVWGKGYQID